jgi:hypothetical protein
MTLSRRIRLRFAVLSLLGMLAAQWTVAAYACVFPAFVREAPTAVTVECDQHHMAAPTPLCYRHCVGDQGGSAANAAALIAPPVDPRAVLSVPPVHPAELQVSHSIAPWPGRPPPLRILLQRFLT